MAQKDRYKELLKRYPDEVSKEQLCKICHISKKTARYLLQTGLIPCVQSGKKTRNYTIKMKDIIYYLKHREIYPEKYKLPAGSYNGTYVPKPKLPETVTASELQSYYRELFEQYPDVVTTRQASEMTGSSISCIVKWIRAGKVKAFPKCNTFIIPKCCLIEYMASYDYRNRRCKSKKQFEDIGGFLAWQQEKLS